MSESETRRRLSLPQVDRLKELVRTHVPSEEDARATRVSGLGTLGRYVLLEELGRGGCGVVYRAHDSQLGRDVALKTIIGLDDPQMRARLFREARIAAQLDHPGIVRVYDVGECGRQVYLTMEIVEGSPLDALAPSLPRRRLVELIRDVARTLQFAHDRGVVHRDLKPSNILVPVEGPPRIVDFGLARDVDPASRLTQTGFVAGTPAYMSPEQIAGKSVDPRADVYSLGVVLYEVTTGRLPFATDNMFAMIQMVTLVAPPAPRSHTPDLEPDLEAIILKAMEKDRTRRYARTEDLAADLDAWLAQAPVAASRERFGRWWRRHRRRMGRIGAASTVAAALLVVLSLALHPPPAEQAPVDPEKATKLREQATGVLWKVRKRWNEIPATELTESLDSAERDLREALVWHDRDKETWFRLADCLELRGDYEAAAKPCATVGERMPGTDQAMSIPRETHARIALLVTHTLPGANGFEWRKLWEQEGFSALIARLRDTNSMRKDQQSQRRRAILGALLAAVRGERDKALAEADKVVAIEEVDDDKVHSGRLLLAALGGESQGSYPLLADLQAADRLPVFLARCAVWIRIGRVPMARNAKGFVKPPLRTSPTFQYLSAVLALSAGDLDGAEGYLGECAPSEDQRHLVTYLRGLCALERDPASAAERFRQAAREKPDFLEARVHLAAALSLQSAGLPAGEERTALLGAAWEALSGAVNDAKAAGRYPREGKARIRSPLDRTMWHFNLCPDWLQQDPALETLRRSPSHAAGWEELLRR